MEWKVENGIRFLESERMTIEVDNATNQPSKIVVYLPLPSNEKQLEITFRAIDKERIAQIHEEFIADTNVEQRYPWTRFVRTVSRPEGEERAELKPFVLSGCSPSVQYGAWLASLVENSLGVESPQYQLFENWIGDQSVFVSEFEEKLHAVRQDERFGPLSAFLFCAMTDASANSIKDVVARIGLEQLAKNPFAEQKFAMEKMEAFTFVSSSVDRAVSYDRNRSHRDHANRESHDDSRDQIDC